MQIIHSLHYAQTPSINRSSELNKEFKAFVQKCLLRHLSGDWGETPEEDQQLNKESLTTGDRIMSSYQFPESLYKEKLGYMNTEITEESKLWIITDGANDEKIRLVTTILFPSEY